MNLVAGRLATHHDQRFLAQAVALACRQAADGRYGPFGAVITVEDQVVAEGWNQVVATHDPTAHAEMVAIRNACRTTGCIHLPHAVLYASCQPCPMCLAAIAWARIPRVVFAATAQDAAMAGFLDQLLHQSFQSGDFSHLLEMVHLPLTGAEEPLHAWRASQTAQRY